MVKNHFYLVTCVSEQFIHLFKHHRPAKYAVLVAIGHKSVQGLEIY